jgi:hypothetical protein
MINKLRWLYTVLLNNYYYRKKKDLNEAKELAYGITRNVIGAIIFMSLLFLSVFISCVFHLKFHLENYRLEGYLVFAIIILSYMYFGKKRIQPLFLDIEVTDKELYIKNNYHIYLTISMGILGGAMYVISRLIIIYFCN